MNDLRKIDPLTSRVNRFQDVPYQFSVADGELSWHISSEDYRRNGLYARYTALCGEVVPGGNDVRISYACTPPRGEHCQQCADRLEVMRRTALEQMQEKIEQEESAGVRPPWTAEGFAEEVRNLLALVDSCARSGRRSEAENAEFTLRKRVLEVIVREDLSHGQINAWAQLALSTDYYIPWR